MIMNISELKRFYNYSIYPKHSKKNTYKRFIKIDVGSLGGLQWTCFYKIDNESFCAQSVDG